MGIKCRSVANPPIKKGNMSIPNTKCRVCSEPIHRSPSDLKRSKSGNVFCSHSCSAKISNTKRTGMKHPSWDKYFKNYRHRAFTTYGVKCASVLCPLERAGIYLPKDMYDVDHVDSNRLNNEISNLQVLCVYCHALKTRKIDMVL